MKEQGNAVNTFKDGLLMDTNPLSNDGTSLTNALNATLTTNNGNELMLQNDMGNGRINKVRLDEGYIPVGIKEHGGIIYIASYNPETKKGQIGSFPYPKVEYDNSDFIDDDEGYNTPLDYIYGNGDPQDSKSVCTDAIIYFNEIIHNSQKVKLFTTTNEDGEQVQVKFKQGDSFSLIFDPETSEYLKADNIVASIISKTASNYVVIHTISKEELEKEDPISVTYDHSYSGTLFLQISLNIPDTFDINYEYNYNNNNFIVYPNAYNSEDPENIHTSTVDVVLKNSNQHTTNFGCDSFITLSPGIYDICPVTSDKGYLKYLEQKVILDANSKNNIFKYTFNDGELDLYWDILTNSHYSEGTSYRFTYTFYPLEEASSVTSLKNLQQLPYTVQISKEGYPVISGLRNLKCTLSPDTIYVLLVTVATKYQNTYSDEQPCFSGFIYGTSRYNDKFEEIDNFNNIEKEVQEISYTFNRQLLELNREYIINQHRIQSTPEDKWEPTQSVILFSDSLISEDAIPIAYTSEIAVKISKTTEPVIVAPKQNVEFIYDSDQFSIESSKFDINLEQSEIVDIPEKNKNNRLITSYDANSYKQADKNQDFIIFYRYISSEGSDGQSQQIRTLQQLMPIFNPNADNYEELFGFDYGENFTTGVFGSRKFLNMTTQRDLTVGTDIGKDAVLECKSEGNPSPGVIKEFLLRHGEDYRGQDAPSIFDLFAGAAYSEDQDTDNASLELAHYCRVPYKKFSGLANNCSFYEFDAESNYMMPSCLTYTNQPLLLILPSPTIGIHYSQDYETSYNNRSKYPKNYITSADQLNNREQDLLIPAFKKLFCLLSQIFTLQSQETYVYIVGPSEVTINYNVQDNSYVKYNTALSQNIDIFIDNDIQQNLDSVESYLKNSNIEISPKNYIGRLKLNEQQDNYFYYGRDVNMDSILYNNILSQYINAYDDAIVIDNSSGYSANDIYFLDITKLWKKYKDNINSSIEPFNYTEAHDRITNNSNYPMDNAEGEKVIDGNYNKIWPDYNIYYNPTYNCYQYDLSKADYINLLTKSNPGGTNWLLDWAGNCWRLNSLIDNFITIEEAKNTRGSQLASYTNNYIVLRNLNQIPSTWTHRINKPGPSFSEAGFGFRGGGGDLFYNYKTEGYTQFQDYWGEQYYGGTGEYIKIGTDFLHKITNKIQDIINLYNHNQAATSGKYAGIIDPSAPVEPVTH